MTIGIAPRRKKPRWVTLVVAIFVFTFSGSTVVLAGPVSTAATFEGDDGNLVNGGNTDWNDFDAGTNGWLGTAPLRTRSETVSGWKFNGLEDYQNNSSDTVFAGGVKQDNECPVVQSGPKPPNKDDLKRVYFASKQVGGNTYLALAWERIPQNTTSASAHVAFEFNRDDPHNACGGSSNGLVHRSVDLPLVTGDQSDMLIVYDFEGGTATPVLKLSRWIASGTCEVGSNSPPCWGPVVNLTAGGFAEAKVNTTDATDQLAPGADDTLHSQEFGEAIINLTGAGVFSAGTCTSFGKAYAVSRSSGNSAQAQMKDLVGPGDIGLSNCGQIKIIKRTDPRGLNQSFPFTSNINNSATATCSPDATPASFSLNDNGNSGTTDVGNFEDCTNVGAGSYTVTEGSDPGGFELDSISCVVSGAGTSATPSKPSRNVSITLAGNGSVTCTFVNKQLTGAIKVTKTGKDARCTAAATPDATCVSAGVRRLSGATFQLKKGSTVIGNMAETSTAGVYCTDGLLFGTDYTVQETAAPNGYKRDDTAVSGNKTINAAGTCTSGTQADAGTYTDTPLTTIQVKVTSLAGAGVTVSQIVCKQGTTVVPAESENGSADNETTPVRDDTDETFGNGTSTLVPGVYTCTIDVDP